MNDRVEVSREIAEWAQAKMAWDANPRIRAIAKDLRKLLDGASVVKRQEPVIAESPAMDVLRAELEGFRTLNHNQILAEAVGRHLLNSGAKNYTGEVFTIALDDGAEQFEVVVITQKVGAKNPHELRIEAEQRTAKLVEVLKGLPEGFKDLSGSECTAGVTACIEYTEHSIFEALKAIEPETSNECSNCNVSKVATTFDGDGVPRDEECQECKNGQ